MLNKAEEVRSMIQKTEIKGELPRIEKYISQAAHMLRIDVPEIYIVPYIYTVEEKIAITEKPWPYTINNYGGYYYYDLNIMIVSGYDPITCKKQDKFLTLYYALHELRHKWQYDMADDKNAFLTSIQDSSFLTDPYEVDADAFAKVYLDTLPGSRSKDFRLIIWGDFSFDNGLRTKRASSLKSEYFPQIAS